MQLKARPGVAASSVALSYSRPLKNELPAKTPAQQVARPASHAVAREMGVRAQFPVRPCCLLWAGEREIGIRPQFHYTCAPFQHCNSGRRRSDFGVGLPFHCACAPFEHCISGRKCSDFGVRSPFRCAFAPFVHCISGRRRSDFGVGSQLLADSVNHCSRRQKAIGLRPQYHGPGPESPKNNSCQRIFHGGYRPIWPETLLKVWPGAAASSVALSYSLPAPQVARPSRLRRWPAKWGSEPNFLCGHTACFGLVSWKLGSDPNFNAPVLLLSTAKAGADAVILGSDPNCLPILSTIAPGAKKQLGSDPNITGQALSRLKTIAASAYSTGATGQFGLKFN